MRDGVRADPNFVGTLTSLYLFVVMKAGVLVAVDARSLNSSTVDLNPFFVACVGIVGGLISTQVVERIMITANDWFRGASSDRLRYAQKIPKTEMQDAGTRAAFAAMAGVAPDALKAWLDADAPISPAGQLALHLWVKKPKRELFTDIPP